MSNKIYCMHCGTSNLYQSIPPKFCGSCGQTVIKSNISSVSTKVIVKPIINKTENEEDVEEDVSFNLNKIKNSLSIDFETKKKNTFWDAINNNGTFRAEMIEDRKNSPKPKTKKDVRAKMQQIREFQDKNVRVQE